MRPGEPCVAIDGPAGAGKSTVSQRVADRLGYVLVDSGALYRSVALAAKNAGVSWDDESGVSGLAADLVARDAIRFEPLPGAGLKLFLEGTDVSTAIRTQEMGEGASRVSALPAVRAALLHMQRHAARFGGVVLEGRDIGTVVLPDAEAKFYLTASVEVRAERRYKELLSRGVATELETVRREVEERDRRDTERSVSPLAQAADAMLVDSTDMTFDEVVDFIVLAIGKVRDRLRAETRG